MAQLTGLGIENFRVFKDYTEFDFAPITILTGTNSSGKSSLFKALLLLADNAKEENPKSLNFSGKLAETHLLGSFSLSVNNEVADNVMSFEILYEIENKYYTLLLKYEKTNGSGNRLIEFGIKTLNVDSNEKFYTHRILYQNEYQKYTSYLGISYFIEQKFTKNLSKEDYFNHDDSDTRNINFISSEVQNIITNIGDDNSMFLQELNKNIIYWLSLAYTFIEEEKLDIRNVYNKYHYEKLSRYAKFDAFLIGLPQKNRQNFTENSVYKPFFEALAHLNIRELLKKEYVDYLLDIPNDAYKLVQELQKCLDFEHESATRANARREYKTISEGTTFNELLVRFNKLEFTESSDEKIFINKWVNELGIAEKVEFIWHEIRGTEIKFYKNGKILDLTDLGFGITQLLPILIHITICKTQYLILEELESNLHPAIQSKLADMLIDAHKKFHINFIVETHSEYFIRKLKYLTAIKSQGITTNESIIYYFNEPNHRQMVKTIRILQDGTLDDDFGTGFFDETDKLAMSLYKIHKGNRMM
jgi:predicted ATPase